MSIEIDLCDVNLVSELRVEDVADDRCIVGRCWRDVLIMKGKNCAWVRILNLVIRVIGQAARTCLATCVDHGPGYSHGYSYVYGCSDLTK